MSSLPPKTGELWEADSGRTRKGQIVNIDCSSFENNFGFMEWSGVEAGRLEKSDESKSKTDVYKISKDGIPVG